MLWWLNNSDTLDGFHSILLHLCLGKLILLDVIDPFHFLFFFISKIGEAISLLFDYSGDLQL